MEVGHTRCLVDGHFGYVKEHLDSNEVKGYIFKKGITVTKARRMKMPVILLPAGLT